MRHAESERRIAVSALSIVHTENFLAVGGRVLRGPLVVGDSISRVCDKWTGDGECDDACRCERATLTVERILLYGNFVNVIDAGFGVEVEFAGDLAVRLGPMDVLVGVSSVAVPDHEILGEGRLRVPVI